MPDCAAAMAEYIFDNHGAADLTGELRARWPGHTDAEFQRACRIVLELNHAEYKAHLAAVAAYNADPESPLAHDVRVLLGEGPPQ